MPRFPVLRRFGLLVALALIGVPFVPQAGEAEAETAPARQPNVLVWMMDDVGFAQVSSFGGLVETPNIDRVAMRGLRYTNYHTAPICSAARASFLTGRMPHSVHIGGHATAARAFPGYDAHIPASAGTVAANLSAGGYATFALGKWDHLPNAHAGPAGPFTYWPAGQGFERFYGFLAADADNFAPVLWDNVSAAETPSDEDYHLSEDMADRALAMIAQRHGRDPARPFFIYWATGAAHAPHHAPQQWRDHYRGRFDGGWDLAREEILARQVELGLMPQNTPLAARPDSIPAWDALPADTQRLYARQMEAFAAALSHADAQFGRILDALEAAGELDNTIVIIVSDNGASAEGGPFGLYNEAQVTGGSPSSVEVNLPFYDVWGSRETYPHYSAGWAMAGDTPLAYWKQTTHEGGTRVPLVISWPGGIAAGGEVRRDFVHVSDVAPTILDAAGVALAEYVNDVPQAPMEGESFLASFAAPGDPRAGRAQYVELYGNRGLWQQGWSIVTTHRTATWDWNTAPTFDEPWELYDLVNDPGQTRNLAADHAELVAEMDAAFWQQVERFNVEPIHNLRDTAAESMRRVGADFMRRGGLWRYIGEVSGIPNELAPPINSRSFAMNARFSLARENPTAPMFAAGGAMGGMALYLEAGVPVLAVRELDGRLTRIAASHALGAGSHELQLEMRKGERLPDGRTHYAITISANGETLLQAEQALRIATFFGISETFGIGRDRGSAVLDGYRDGAFPGSIKELTFQFDTSEAQVQIVH